MALAVRNIRVREQDLRGVDAIFAKTTFIRFRQSHLTNRRRGLHFLNSVRTLTPAEPPHPFSTRARTHERHLLAQIFQTGDLRRPASDGLMIESAPFVGDQTGAYFDDEPLRCGNRKSTRLNSSH